MVTISGVRANRDRASKQKEHYSPLEGESTDEVGRRGGNLVLRRLVLLINPSK